MNSWMDLAMRVQSIAQAGLAYGKILLVHEKNGTRALPGGWCDVDQSIASNIEKETKEEAGLEVKADPDVF